MHASWPLPTFARFRNFLPAAEHQALLRWVLENENRFRPAKLIGEQGSRGKLDPEFRTALTCRDLDEVRPMLEARLRDALPVLQKATGTTGEAPSIELELAAHGEGAHYKPHVDISYGAGRQPVGAETGEDRVLSAVYYFYREPKAFSGGELRLFRFDVRPSAAAEAAPDDHIDLEPLQNTLVGFAPWVTHEVRPVDCPSGKFPDCRFALNCWFCRKLESAER
jgi:Rps23 Pro-64 3,4-dihydroxylase Tpa1-like proline 4-hydroxylase